MTDINIGAISEALNNEVDLPTPSTPQDAVDYVVEKQDPTSANGYTWYRKYKSGWVEQGGHIDGGVDSYYLVNLPLEMSDVKYSITLGVGGYNTSGGFNSGYRDQTTTSFRFIFHNAGTSGENFGSWQVSGYEA